MSASRVRLWLIRSTDRAYLFSKTFRPTGDGVWVPRSVCEHISWEPQKPGVPYREAEVTLPDWFIEREKL